ncbi:MAG: glycosyltransferase family 2 protein [Bacteroidetes bacterium]|nr:glycosyltransferase family 2 protein [Bacteroidota bacterium]MDA1122236.1 glycosyltransferase family 2 protein [Bacteroidota bacterium]
MAGKIDVSIIVPLFNEEESLPELSEWVSSVMAQNGHSFEVIMVDDGSTDDSWNQIVALSAKNPAVKGLKLNRNYGKSAALNTGFKAAIGDIIITMDADLQDSPDEIPGLVDMINNEGYDLVSGWKKKRHDPITKTIPSKFFNFITRKISGIKLHDFNCGLKAYKSKVVKSINLYGEMHRYIPYLAKWHGFYKIGEKIVTHRPRKYGKTKFGLERFINGFLDLLSITLVTKFKQRPMHFFGTLGTLTFMSGGIITLWLIGEKVYHLYKKLPVRDIVDQPLFFLALVAIVIGTQLFLAGFLAELVMQNQDREHNFLISESVGLERNA